MTGRSHRRALRLFGAAILAGALTALLAGPAAATFKGRNGRIPTAWLDDDQGAHEEAAYAVLTVPWRTGSAGRNLHSCTALEGCAEHSDPAYSADGTRIVYTRSPDVTGTGGKSELVMENAGGGSPATISSSTQNLFEASFYPSGRRLVFVRSPNSSPEIEVDPSGRIVTSNLTGGTLAS